MNFNQNKSQLNNKFKNVTDYLSAKMSSCDQNNPNPVETLSPEDITYLQTYLEQIKIKKINQIKGPNPNIDMSNNRMTTQHNIGNHMQRSNRAVDIYDPISREVPIDWRTYRRASPIVNQSIEPGSRSAFNTRLGKRSQQTMYMNKMNDYYNPYEYGSKQNSLPPIYKQPYRGPYSNNSEMLNNMGLSEDMYYEKFPGQMRNINVESSLLQKEMTHIPGQRQITQKEIDRFELLPFDPQDPKHIVWSDNMPRGGYATRSERLEY